MDWQSPPGSYLWDIFASEISHKGVEQQAVVAQAVVDAGGANVCVCCGQVIAVATPVNQASVSLGQSAMSPISTKPSAALQIAQTKLSQLQVSQDQDITVINTWIARVQSMGVDFLNDPTVMDLRQEVLQSLWDRDEERRVAVYAQIQSAESDQLDSLNSQYQDIIGHQQIITDLLAGSCIWMDS